jgi:hypothetical protein
MQQGRSKRSRTISTQCVSGQALFAAWCDDEAGQPVPLHVPVKQFLHSNCALPQQQQQQQQRGCSYLADKLSMCTNMQAPAAALLLSVRCTQSCRPCHVFATSAEQDRHQPSE